MEKTIHDIITGEVTVVELTAKEITEIEKKIAANDKLVQAEAAEKATKATARQAILDRLGLTAEEVNLLLG